MLIYICGENLMNTEQAHKAEIEAHLKGHSVLCASMLPSDLNEETTLPIRIAMINQSDAVYHLNGWDDDSIAAYESEYAARIGKKRIFNLNSITPPKEKVVELPEELKVLIKRLMGDND